MKKNSSDPLQLVQAAQEYIAKESGIKKHDIALILGSGWGQTVELLGEEVSSLNAADIPGFTPPIVKGHSAHIRSIYINDGANKGKHALVLGSRTHLYEGQGVNAVTHGVRTAAASGCKTLILTNGCGTTNPQWKPGNPVIIHDHINFTGVSPLTGAHFVDLTDLYSPRLRTLAKSINPGLEEGVYMQFPGPNYETPAEVKMAKSLGADLVGMSTVLEAISGRAVGMEIFGISLVTNLGAGISNEPISHKEVLETGHEAYEKIGSLLAKIIQQA